MRRRPELYGNFRDTGRKPFPGTQIKWHAGPPPVVDLQLCRYERLRSRIFRHTGLIPVSRQLGRIFSRNSWTILAANDLTFYALWSEGPDRLQHFYFFIA